MSLAGGVTADGADTLRPGPSEVACRLVAHVIPALEASHGTGLSWEWRTVRQHLGARGGGPAS